MDLTWKTNINLNFSRPLLWLIFFSKWTTEGKMRKNTFIFPHALNTFCSSSSDSYSICWASFLPFLSLFFLFLFLVGGSWFKETFVFYILWTWRGHFPNKKVWPHRVNCHIISSSWELKIRQGHCFKTDGYWFSVLLKEVN